MKQIPPLADGETYVGSIGDRTGNMKHIILLPGDAAPAPWKEQMAWAKSIGGDLPTRVEQALLYATCREHFERNWYWSSEEGDPGWAWFQDFLNGLQYGNRQDDRLRARAVRRLTIDTDDRTAKGE